MFKDKPHQDRSQWISSHRWLHCHILQSLLIHPGIKAVKFKSQTQISTHSQNGHIVGVSRIFEPAERADVIPAIYRGGEGTAREWRSSCSSISLKVNIEVVREAGEGLKYWVWARNYNMAWVTYKLSTLVSCVVSINNYNGISTNYMPK